MFRVRPPPPSAPPPSGSSSSPPQAVTPIANAATRQPVAANQREFKETPPHKGLTLAAILRAPVPAAQQSATYHGRMPRSGEPRGARQHRAQGGFGLRSR